jgi:hypothetical protein
VEFALVLPLLLVLFLGLADFGRVFQAGIVVEAAARNAAEIVAEEYRRNPPGGLPMVDPAPPGDDAYYQPLHDLAARTVCRELRILANTTYTPDNPATVGVNEESCEDGGTSMPVVRACVHDNEDTLCDEVGFGAVVPPGCRALVAPLSNAHTGGTEASRYVEVSVCYRFTTLFHTAYLDIGDVWLQKTRAFTVAQYPPPPTPSPPPQPTPPLPTAAPTEEPTPTPSESASESASASASAEGSP